MNSTTNFSNHRWLVVDDNADVLNLLGLVLKHIGLAVVEEFSSSPEACARTFEADFELVVTDRDMPEMDGLEFARRVHAQSPKAKILLVSARVDDLTEDDLRRAGICAVLAKPFSVLRIEALIRGLLCESAVVDDTSDSSKLLLYAA